jgi:hypothetical protein
MESYDKLIFEREVVCNNGYPKKFYCGEKGLYSIIFHGTSKKYVATVQFNNKRLSGLFKTSEDNVYHGDIRNDDCKILLRFVFNDDGLITIYIRSIISTRQAA